MNIRLNETSGSYEMWTMKQTILFATFVFVGAMTGCSQPAPPAKGATKPSQPENPSTTAAISRIRAPDAQFDSSVEVKPLRDAAIDGLIKQAHAAENQGNIAAALATSTRALTIAKDAPDILQYQAELYIEQSDWKQAGDVAQRAREHGPKTGSLCARTLRTIIEAKYALGDAAGMQQAQQQLSGCKVPAPVRL
jgi:hypothetical protein